MVFARSVCHALTVTLVARVHPIALSVQIRCAPVPVVRIPTKSALIQVRGVPASILGSSAHTMPAGQRVLGSAMQDPCAPPPARESVYVRLRFLVKKVDSRRAVAYAPQGRFAHLRRRLAAA